MFKLFTTTHLHYLSLLSFKQSGAEYEITV